MIELYNTLSRKKEELKPINKEWVGLYTCGPTVYNYAHIGNLRTYLFEDILQRTLEYNGHEVRRVMNITDVGHLTGDTDAGDDKLDREAQAQKKSVEEIAQFYTDVFFSDLEKLNIKKPDIVAPATKFVREQIAVIETLFENGFAYDTPNAVYFDVSKFKDYGKLSGQALDEKSIGAREEVVVDRDKRNAADFVLWFKLAGKFKKHLLHWPSPWGEGFPGWHIECSAISRHFLGQPFDIHTGGIDLVGTHHENEIAQSEAAFGTPLANIWMHGEHLLINEGKMAKSENNFITVAELENRGYDPIVFRYLTLSTHYRTKLNFSWESLDAAKNGLEGLYEKIYEITKNYSFLDAGGKRLASSLSRDMEDPERYEIFFKEAINDDLNVSKSLAIVHEAINSPKLDPDNLLKLLDKWDLILGLKLKEAKYHPEMEQNAIEKMGLYEQSRANKQFTHSDALRKEIEALGFSVRDTKDGSRLVKKFFNGIQTTKTKTSAAES